MKLRALFAGAGLWLSLALQAHAATSSQGATGAYQAVPNAVSGSAVDIQNTGNDVVYLTTALSAPSLSAAYTILQPGERICRTLAGGNLYARSAGSSAPLLAVDTTLQCPAGGGGGGGSATAANQTATQSAPGTSATTADTVQGVVGGVAVPISAATLPLMTGAATAAKQPALGTAGAAAADVLSMQGISGGTPFGTTTPQPNAGSAYGLTPAVANAVAGLVVKSSPGNLYGWYAVNSSATAGFAILYNSTTLPSAGPLTASLVLDCSRLPASGQAGYSYAPGPALRVSIGAAILLSSGPDCVTYTTGAITGYAHGMMP